MDIKKEIATLKSQKNAVVLAHYYQRGEIQDIADYVGDSLGLSQAAAETKADIILFAGVHFMAETAKILSPDKKVLIPDKEAGCSLADSCPPDAFKAFKEDHPDRVVVSYVNTSAEIKAMTDVVCTSSNAKEIVESLPRDAKIIFAPDRNLGQYVKGLTDRDIIVWDGACHVHEEFSIDKIKEQMGQYPEAKLLVHPECQKPIVLIADHVGSTSSLLRYCKSDDAKRYIVATEPGIIHQMKKENPDNEFIPAKPKDSTCGCSECEYMKLITLEKIYSCLKEEQPEVTMEEELRKKAEVPIRRMLDISARLGL